MIEHFFKPFFYTPLYNGLIFLISVLPGVNVGLAVIILTVVVKLVLFPLTKSSIITQVKMKQLEPALAELRKKYEKDKQEQARQIMGFYRDNNVNPFSGIWLLLIQTPIILSLYYIFWQGGLPVINCELLYFACPDILPSMHFLGMDIGKPSIILGAMAGITQFFQIRLSLPAYKKPEGDEAPSFKNDLARSMNVQFRYVLPVFIFIIALNISGAVSLYWVTSNLFIIGQEIIVRRKFKTVN